MTARPVLGVKHLLRELWNGQCAVLLGTLRRERRNALHEEVVPKEGNDVDGKLPQIALLLAQEPDARRFAAKRISPLIEADTKWFKSQQVEVVITSFGSNCRASCCPRTRSHPRSHRADVN